MRLWSLHPQYLDPRGLVALWREGLLAKKVLEGNTRGYRHHPQLLRFRSCKAPLAAMNYYLAEIWNEAHRRNYHFNKDKIKWNHPDLQLTVTGGQLEYEWEHLLAKLKLRAPELFELHKTIKQILPHPLFQIIQGEIASWEKNVSRETFLPQKSPLHFFKEKKRASE